MTLPSAAPKKMASIALAKKKTVEEFLPDDILNMGSQLNSESPQHEEPKDHHQWQIKATECGGIELGKGKVQCSTCGQQPNLIAIPDWADRANHATAIFRRTGNKRKYNAGTQIEAVKHNVCGDHDSDDTKPNGFHGNLSG